ncbi:MAG: hypothetical protein JSU70_05380, partial [Phycisphaerales bacterium]
MASGRIKGAKFRCCTLYYDAKRGEGKEKGKKSAQEHKGTRAQEHRAEGRKAEGRSLGTGDS